MRKYTFLACLLAAACLALAPVARADEITDQIERGLKLYKEGKISEALSELDYAAGLLRQKKAEAIAALFPPAPSGWKAEKAESQALGQAIFGGGIHAERVYKAEKGNGRVKLEIMSDSPWLQTLAMVLTNPMLAQSQGGKLIRIGDEKALLQVHDGRAEISLSLDSKILVKVEAQADKAEDLAKDFLGRVDLKKLRELSR
jgi:hypothetical protein